MIREISYGVNFIRKLMESKFSVEQLERFTSSLTAILQGKYSGHWKPQQPNHGNAYRSIHTTAEKMDPVIRCAAEQAELLDKSVMAALPCCLTVWIDPFEVSYRIGTHGSICSNTVSATDSLPAPTTAPAKSSNSNIEVNVIPVSCTQAIDSATTTPPASPARAAAPRTPLLPLPLTRRPSEIGFAPPPSPPSMRSRNTSREVLFSPQRRMSGAVLDAPMLARSPSRVDVYIGYDHGATQRPDGMGELGSMPPPSPRRRSNLELMTNVAHPLVLSH